MSLEQAYYLFLDPARNGLKYEQYVVYAHFMRTGFLVLKHDQQLDKQTFEANTNQSQNQLDNELIWCNLLKNLNLPFNEELALEHKESFEAMNSSVVQSSNNIKDQKTTGFAYNELNQDIEMENAKPTTRSFYLRVKCPTKRKLNSSEEPPVKVPRLNENHYLDILKVEQIQISNLVSIDIIKKTPLVSGGRELEFDVYLPDTNYKKTLLPDYRMIVVK